jgi:glycolate oxidase FAD binding subunit
MCTRAPCPSPTCRGSDVAGVVERLAARDAGEVADAVAWANAEGKAIALEGAGTKAAIGGPVAADLRLSLAGLSGVVAYEPSELVLTVLPGTPLAEIEALLTQNGQRLAFEPMDHGPLLGGKPGLATLGGIIAAGASGPRRIKAGAARDHVLGFAAVSGRGEAFKAGGKVVKNVTGYDLSKLITGSWGTLAVMTEVTVKVLPAPPRAQTLLIAGAADTLASRAMSAALNAPAEVTAAAHLPASIAARCPIAAIAAAGGPITALRLEGVEPSLEPSALAVAAALGGLEIIDTLQDEDTARLWRWIRDVEAFAGDARQVWRLSLAPLAGPAAVEAIAREMQVEACYDWAGGLVWLACDDHLAAGPVVRGAIARLGGHATLIRASEASRRAIGAFQPEPPALAALSRRVKAAFDPKGVLNPGRLWPTDT